MNKVVVASSTLPICYVFSICFPLPTQVKRENNKDRRAGKGVAGADVLTDSLRSQFIKVSLGLPTVTPELQNLIYCKKQNILFFLSGDDRFARFLHFFYSAFLIVCRGN